jgi:exopolyphosphatase/guanosine-5'-triphosphate,3'-diphosphate pyrophosphatase
VTGSASAEPAIVPRWEWRTFGESFGVAEERLAAISPTKAEDSDELYVLSRRAEASCKVRSGQLDVKRLEQVDEDGLQQWRPVAKAELPVAAADVAALLRVLGASVPDLASDHYDLERLVAEVVDRNEDLLAVPVSKHRVHYVVDGCMAELTDVRSGGQAVRTIAVENEDPAVVRSTVDALGLWDRPNVSFPRGLALLAGFGARHAIVDVGTNSVKLVVGERSADGSWTHLVDRSEVTRLGEGLAASGRLDPEATRRTVEAVAELVDEARSHGADVVATGTAWMRAAANADELLATVLERSGVRIELIDGVEEARLSYLAAVAGLGPTVGPLVVFETGGGSTQFTFGQGERIDERFSVDVGSVRLMEQFGLANAVGEERIAAALDSVAVDLAPLEGREAPDLLVGLGGAVTNLAAVKHGLRSYDRAVVQGTVLDVSEIDRQIELYRTRDADGRRSIAGLQPKRAETILAGACVVRAVLTRIGCESLTVSDRGLRHRLLVERFGG